MSYPWWRFQVMFEDGYTTQFSATGMTVSDAMRELLDVTYGPAGEDDFSMAVKKHGEPKRVEFLHLDTYGIDPESDKIILAELAEREKDD